MTSVVKCMSYTAHPFLYLRYDLSAQLRDSKGLESSVRKLKLPDLFIAYLQITRNTTNQLQFRQMKLYSYPINSAVFYLLVAKASSRAFHCINIPDRFCCCKFLNADLSRSFQFTCSMGTPIKQLFASCLIFEKGSLVGWLWRDLPGDDDGSFVLNVR
jgi:hypothetical protein